MKTNVARFDYGELLITKSDFYKRIICFERLPEHCH